MAGNCITSTSCSVIPCLLYVVSLGLVLGLFAVSPGFVLGLVLRFFRVGSGLFQGVLGST